MVKPDLKQTLPTSAELPCSDDTPVDNEDQNFIPNFLLFLLNTIWAKPTTGFLVDMGIYHTTGVNPEFQWCQMAFEFRRGTTQRWQVSQKLCGVGRDRNSSQVCPEIVS